MRLARTRSLAAPMAPWRPRSPMAGLPTPSGKPASSWTAMEVRRCCSRRLLLVPRVRVPPPLVFTSCHRFASEPGIWSVPPTPSVKSVQTLFLFTGFQNSFFAYEPASSSCLHHHYSLSLYAPDYL